MYIHVAFVWYLKPFCRGHLLVRPTVVLIKRWPSASHSLDSFGTQTDMPSKLLTRGAWAATGYSSLSFCLFVTRGAPQGIVVVWFVCLSVFTRGARGRPQV